MPARHLRLLQKLSEKARATWLHVSVETISAVSRERGQALVLIAATSFALVSMLALVIETGNIYAEQRRMQSAADAAAMAGAQNWLSASSQLDVAEAIADARLYATRNGYTTSVAAGNGVWDPDSDSGVQVNIPPSSGPYSGSTQYVEVLIRKPVATLFAGVFNVGSIPVSTRAVSRGTAGSLEASVIALSHDDAAISTEGGSSTMVYGNLYSAGGIKCGAGNIQVYQGAAYAVTQFGENCLDGQLVAANGLYTHAPPLEDPGWPSFEPLAPLGPTGNWTSAGHTPDADGYIHVEPGTYNSITVGSNDYVKFEPGVYHLLGQGDNPALTVRGTVASAGALQFVLEAGALHFEAQARGELSSGPEYNNILIYSKSTIGDTAINITGGASLVYNGTIYAPGANVLLAGNSSAVINGQVVANTVTFAGSSDTAVNWVAANAPTVIAPALME